ncbi:MAG: hypothetical protein ACTTKW_01000 [Schwartzia sp. (in: firmicutes)]
MVKGIVRVKKRGQFLGRTFGRITPLINARVYVGVPAENAPREGDTINNAELLYIQTHGVRDMAMRDDMAADLASGMKYSAAHSLYVKEHGSPLWHIPPRPVLEPAIKERRKAIAKQLKAASVDALCGKKGEALAHFSRAGQIGANAARRWFHSQNNQWPPNAVSTVKRKGSNAPLIDTGAMRQAITYVVEKDKGAK